MFKPLLQKLFFLVCLAAGLTAPSPALAAPGDLVPAFGTGGVVTASSSGYDGPRAIAIDPNSNAMYLVGTLNAFNGRSQWRIERRRLDTGSLVSSFGAGGVMLSDPTDNNDEAEDIAIDPVANVMYIVGRADGTGTTGNWYIEKRGLDTGALVTAFDGDGAVISDPSTGDDGAVGIEIDPDTNMMYVAGYDYFPFPGNYQWRIEKRRLDTGALDTSFDSDGVVTVNPSTWTDKVTAIAIDFTGNAMYVVGWDYVPTNDQWRIEKRRLDTGARINAFDFDGVVTSNPSPYLEHPQDIAVDLSGNAIYIVGWDDATVSSFSQWRIEKRSAISGSLVSTFDGDGVVTSDPDIGGTDNATAIAIDPSSNAMYVIGHFYNGTSGQWRIEKRQLDTGGLVATFGSGGVVIGPTTQWVGQPQAVAVDTIAGMMYIGGSSSPPSAWRIEKRESGAGGGPGPSGVDCGVRMYDSTATVTLTCEDPPVSPLRIYQGTKTYGISVVDPADANATRFRIQTPSGVKALRRQ